jgi:hypothetical protein
MGLIASFTNLLLFFVGRKVSFLKPDIVKSCTQIVRCLLVGWVGFGCCWAKLNVQQFGLVCVLELQLFNFAKSRHFCRLFLFSFVVGCVVF